MGQKQSYTLNDPNRQSTNSDEVAYDISVPDKSSAGGRAALQQINARQQSVDITSPATKTGKKQSDSAQSQLGSSFAGELDVLGPTKELEDCENEPSPSANAHFTQPVNDENFTASVGLDQQPLHPQKQKSTAAETQLPVNTAEVVLESNAHGGRSSRASSHAAEEDRFEDCECPEPREQQQQPQQQQQQFEEQQTRDSAVGWVFSSEAPHPPPPYPHNDEQLDRTEAAHTAVAGNNPETVADILSESVTNYGTNELPPTQLELTPPPTQPDATAQQTPCCGQVSDEAAAMGKVVELAHAEATFIENAHKSDVHNTDQNDIILVGSALRKAEIASNDNSQS